MLQVHFWQDRSQRASFAVLIQDCPSLGYAFYAFYTRDALDDYLAKHGGKVVAEATGSDDFTLDLGGKTLPPSSTYTLVIFTQGFLALDQLDVTGTVLRDEDYSFSYGFDATAFTSFLLIAIPPVILLAGLIALLYFLRRARKLKSARQ